MVHRNLRRLVVVAGLLATFSTVVEMVGAGEISRVDRALCGQVRRLETEIIWLEQRRAWVIEDWHRDYERRKRGPGNVRQPTDDELQTIVTARLARIDAQVLDLRNQVQEMECRWQRYRTDLALSNGK